jgi:LmeA-like phospholipid-binding
MIDRLLTKAIPFWLRIQAEAVEELEMEILGGDRKLLSGNIPQVSLSCSRAIYQGIHLRHIDITASNIRINIGQIVKGKPLRLLEPIPITGNLVITAEDLQNSVASPLLNLAFSDFLAAIWEKSDRSLSTCPNNYAIDWQEIQLQTDKFVLRGTIEATKGQIYPIVLRSGLELSDSHTLRLSPLQVEAAPLAENLTIQDFSVDLGDRVSIEELSLTEGCLTCNGGLEVMP